MSEVNTEGFAQSKKYLMNSFRLQEIYKSKSEQLKQLKLMYTSLSSTMSAGEKIKSSPNLHGQENKICNVVDLERQIEKDLEDMINLRLEITNKINDIDNQNYKLLLNLRYLNCYTFEKISCEMNISFRWVMKMHKKSLMEFERKHFTDCS